jgi:tetratricopeptide (TPR) repeat protein
MSDLNILNEENANVYDRLIVSLESGLGTLQILLAVCDNTALKHKVITLYESELGTQGVRVYRLALNLDEPSLLQALIDGKIDKNTQAIATVLGAEKLSNLGANNRERLDSFLGYLQWTREALRGYPLPIVLWLPSAVLVEVAQKAPDFWSWRSGGTFQFGFAKLNLPIDDSGKDPIFKPIDNPQKSSSVLSIKQLEDSLAEALTTWGEDSANIEPIYAQLGSAYAERVWTGKTENLNREIELAEIYLDKAIALQARFNRKFDLAFSLSNLGYMYSRLGDWDKAESFYKQSLQLRIELGDRGGMASSLSSLGAIERNRGNWDAAESLLRQSLQLRAELWDRKGIASSYLLLGDIERKRGNWDSAESLYRQSLQLRTELGDRAGMATSWGLLGEIERKRGNWDAAESLYRQYLQVMEELGNRVGITASIGCLGEIELGRGNLVEAEKLLKQALTEMESLGMTWNIGETNWDLALLEKQRGNLPLAQQYYDQAKTIYQQLGAIKDLERIDREWNLIEQSES